MNSVTLTVIHEGSAWLRFGCKPADGVYRSGYLQGIYEQKDGMLYFRTEQKQNYVFRFEGEDLVFVEDVSSPVPENCILHDGMVLKADLRFE